MIIKDVRVCEYDKPNKNGRIYKSDCFDLNNPIIKEQLSNGCLFGELNFPEDDRTAEIDMTKVSHRIISLHQKEDGLYADIEILDTPRGKMLEKTLNKNNFRTRGFGKLTLINNDNYVVEDYEFITIDSTNNPA